MKQLIINGKIIPIEGSDNNSLEPSFLHDSERTGLDGTNFRSHQGNYNTYQFKTIPLNKSEFNEIYSILANTPPYITVGGDAINKESIKMNVSDLNDDDIRGIEKTIEFTLEEVNI